MDVQPEEIGEKALIARPIRRQFSLQFFVSIFALAAIRVFFVNRPRKDFPAGSNGGYRTPIGSLRMDFPLNCDIPRRVPGGGLV